MFDDAIILTIKMIALSVSHDETKFGHGWRKISNDLFLMKICNVIRQ